MDFSQFPAKYLGRVWSARLSLWAERLLNSFQELILWTSGFVCLALFNFQTDILSALFWLGFFVLLSWGIYRFKAPTVIEIQEKAEQGSSLLHRPLRSGKDQPAARLSAEGQKFWDTEATRKAGDLKFLRWITPSFRMTQRDPYALRIALSLLLIIGVIISGPATGSKLVGAFFPFVPSFSAAASSALKVVITPPTYTRKSQIVLNGRPANPVEVPQGSHVRVLMQSWLGHIEIEISNEETTLLQDGKTDVYTADAPIPETDTIQIKQFGFPRLTIPVAYISDSPPSISLRGDLEVVAGGQLKLPLTVYDDYGLKLIRVRAILAADVKSRPMGSPILEEQSIIEIGRAHV